MAGSPRARRSKNPVARPSAAVAKPMRRLLGDTRTLIESARERAAQAVNAGLVLLYWAIGDRIRREILGEKRAEYGEQIVSTLSRQLAAEYGRGFSRRNLLGAFRFGQRSGLLVGAGPRARPECGANTEEEGGHGDPPLPSARNGTRLNLCRFTVLCG